VQFEEGAATRERGPAIPPKDGDALPMVAFQGFSVSCRAFEVCFRASVPTRRLIVRSLSPLGLGPGGAVILELWILNLVSCGGIGVALSERYAQFAPSGANDSGPIEMTFSNPTRGRVRSLSWVTVDGLLMVPFGTSCAKLAGEGERRGSIGSVVPQESRLISAIHWQERRRATACCQQALLGAVKAVTLAFWPSRR
jgi:hypothetical protein